MSNTTHFATNRGTPLSAWFLLLGTLGVVMASVAPSFGSPSSEVDQFACAAGAVFVGLVFSIAGATMGLLSANAKVGSVVGCFGGLVMGVFVGASLGVAANFQVTLMGSGTLIAFALVVRALSRRATVAAVLTAALGCSLMSAASSFAADPAPAAKPKVLILGDSISLGYTPLVKANLADVADVLRPRENCQHSAYGLKMIDKWLGQEKWDVIHFNWGIWDTHMLDETGALVRDEATAKGQLHLRHTPEQYRQNLTSLVKTLKGTGAKLIWASTTPIMRYKGKRYDDLTTLNKIAAEIMQENGIAIDDLYEFTLPNIAKLQGGDKVHFTAVGNEALGKKVSEEIRKALPAKKS